MFTNTDRPTHSTTASNTHHHPSQDTTLEFVLMEVFGVFLFAQLFNPLPWHFHVLLAAYNGAGGAIDHSAFYIPGTIIDGRCVHDMMTVLGCGGPAGRDCATAAPSFAFVRTSRC